MEELYTYEQVKAYGVIALNNLLHSANDVNIKNFEMIIETLKDVHKKENVIRHVEIIKELEGKKDEK